MLAAIQHRGPDDAGTWISVEHGLALGHRRLAVRDLSPAGHQPMVSPSGDWALIFNGEIYNADELRRWLSSDIRWRGHSDTEVLAHAFERWGIAQTVARAVGMFAMVVWHRQSQTVTLIRDRLGIKPLYYSIQGQRVFWSSELKSLLAHPDFCATVNRDALQNFLRFGYVPSPASILQRTWKLPAGAWLEFPLSDVTNPRFVRYWDAAEVASRAGSDPLPDDDQQICAATSERLGQIVREHLVADVPLGAFLSGGIDSSLVASLMQASSSVPVRTFAIGFDNPKFDEAPFARQVAATLGTEHHEYYVSATEVAELIPRWAEFYSEPFSDTSGLPSLIVAREARRHVTVALTGDGGDELFAGYRRYQQAITWQGRIHRIPAVVRQTLRRILEWPPAELYQRLDPLQRRLTSRVGEGLAESVRKASSLLATRDSRQLYECLATISFDANARGVLVAGDDVAPFTSPCKSGATPWRTDWDLLDNMQLWDSQVYLPDDILHKVDIASMSVGLEVRVPLLDHRLFEWAWRLPSHWKLANGQGKVILRRILQRQMSAEWFDRPKRGFSAPLDDWLTGPLRDWAEALLDPACLNATGLLSASTVHAYWQDLLAGRAGHARIWPVLVFLSWCDRYLTSGPSGPDTTLP
jgi:asparagine synthase (glutamine-hydrolysing)